MEWLNPWHWLGALALMALLTVPAGIIEAVVR
jgi:hypothetical protein